MPSKSYSAYHARSAERHKQLTVVLDFVIGKRGWGRATLRAGKMRYLDPPTTKLPCTALRRLDVGCVVPVGIEARGRLNAVCFVGGKQRS